MTKKGFQFNCFTAALLLIASLAAVLTNKIVEAEFDKYVQIVLFGFLVFLLLRVIAPLVFTYMDRFSTAKMQQNFRSHLLGRFFLINWEQDNG